MTAEVKKFLRKTTTPPSYVLSDDILQKGYDPYVVSRYLDFLKPYRLRIFLSVILMMISSAAVVAGPYLIQLAIDDGLGKNQPEVLIRSIALFTIFAAVQWLTTFTRVHIMIRVGQSVIFDLRKEIFEHLQALSLSFYSRYSVGRVMSRAINDVGVARRFITWAMLATFRELFTLAGILIAMLLLNLRLSLLSFTVLPIMIWATMYFRNRSRQFYRNVRAANSWVNSVLAENINGVLAFGPFEEPHEQV